MKSEKKFKWVGRIGVIFYLLGTCISAFIFATEGPSYPLDYEDVSLMLNILFVISLITSIFISRTNQKYIVCFVLMILSSLFWVVSLKSALSVLDYSSNSGIVKLCAYSLISNIVIIISIIYSYKKCKKLQTHS
ncbi:MAG: hypothetical protein ACRDD7_15775 [Peptostreptococcaceae bacterium]